MLRRVLIVEDEKAFAELLSDALLSTGAEYSTTIALNGVEALKALDEAEFDLVLTDLHMPEMNGRELLKTIRQRKTQVGLIVLTAFPVEEYVRELNDLGIDDFLCKDDCDLHALQRIVAEFFRRHSIDLMMG